MTEEFVPHMEITCCDTFGRNGLPLLTEKINLKNMLQLFTLLHFHFSGSSTSSNNNNNKAEEEMIKKKLKKANNNNTATGYSPSS